MALWPFHRKSHKRSRSGANLSDPDFGNANTPDNLPRDDTFDVSRNKSKRQKTTRKEPNKLRRRNRALSYSPGRQDSIRVAKTTNNQRRISPQRRSPQRYPFQSDSPHPHTQNSQHHPYPQRDLEEQHTFTHRSVSGGENHHEMQGRIPTLRTRPTHGRINRTKSSKRRKADREREAEIRALTASPEPMRPAAEAWASGRLMRKDSRRVKTRGPFGPSSEISLPSAASIHSSMSTDSEYAAYRVSVFESLAPRPTLKYSSCPAHHNRHPPGEYFPFETSEGDHPGPWRTRSQKRRLADRPPIPEATLRAHKRIDSLADDLDASDIRELMERDKRRRERRRQREQERIDRRLARQAAQAQVAAQQVQPGRSSPPNLERGVMGRELNGMGVSHPPSAVITSSRRRVSHESIIEQVNDDQASMQSNQESTTSSQIQPLEYYHRPESINMNDDNQLPTPPPEDQSRWTPTYPMPLERYEPSLHRDTPISSPPVASASITAAADSGSPDIIGRKSSINRRKSDRRVLTKKGRSKSPPLSHYTQGISSPPGPDDNSTTRKSTETKTTGRSSRMSWTAIFRWPGRSKRSPQGPSSFTNESRDSMASPAVPTSSAPAAPVGAIPTPPVAASSASASSSAPYPGSVPIAPNVTFIPPPREGALPPPRRTVSRFREDLPETPISQPQTRVQSPEAQALTHIPHPVAGENLEPEMPSLDHTSTQNSYGATAHGQEVERASPTSMMGLSSINPSPEPPSVSMASVDSEGSWFGGGRRRTRMSSISRYRQMENMQPIGRAVSPTESNREVTEDESGFGEDTYDSQLTPTASRPLRISTGEAQPSSDCGDDSLDGEATWGTISTPNVVHHQAPRMKSTEVVLHTPDPDIAMVLGDDDKEDSGVDTEESDSPLEGDKAGELQRATSINLGRSHARHISAGSAKLLELSPRQSTDGRRRSTEPPSSITQ